MNDLLAHAIAGRPVELRVMAESGARAHGDGRCIFVPDTADCWKAVAAIASMFAAGSLDRSLAARLIGNDRAIARYVYLEVLRGSFICRDRLPWCFTQLADICPPLTASAAESLTMASGNASLPPTPFYFGTIRPALLMRQAAPDNEISSAGKQASRRRDEPRRPQDEAGETSEILNMFRLPFAGRNPLGKLFADLLGADSHPEQSGRKALGEGAELADAPLVARMRRGMQLVVSHVRGDAAGTRKFEERGRHSYPEWDEAQQRMRPGWVRVHEVEAWRGDGPLDLAGCLSPPPLALLRALRGIGLAHAPVPRQMEGAELDTAALLDCAIALRAGYSPVSPAIYRASRRARRDLAVAIALDISGSTDERDTGGGQVFLKQMELAYRLGHVFESLGDAVTVFGFHGWGRHRVQAVRLKDQGERWGGKVAERFSMLEPSGFTRTGAAIRHATRLLHASLRHRLLILITDGILYDDGYEHGYAMADTGRAIREARRAGTACLCLHVGAGDPLQLKAAFPGAVLLSADAPERISAACRQALALAEGRRARLLF